MAQQCGFGVFINGDQPLANIAFEAWLAAILISCGSRTAVFANSRTLRDSVAEKAETVLHSAGSQ